MPANHQLLLNNEHRLLGLMLFSLLAANHLGESNMLVLSFLIAHFGFFLLWQPVVKKQSTFTIRQLITLSVLIFAFIYWFNPWLSVLWSLLLLTLLTGRIFARGLARAAYGFAVVILFLELILITTPQLFNLSALSSSMQSTFSMILTLLPLGLLLIPVTDTATKQIDFIRGFLVVLLIVFLCMSSALISLTTQQRYIESLAISVFILSLFLLLAAILWTPRSGFAGLAQLWEKYILDIGGPFEEWVSHVSSLETSASLRAENFLAASLRYLLQQHWICGVHWQSSSNNGFKGEKSAHKVSIKDEKLTLTLHTYAPVGPSLMLHAKLLLSVLTFYYRAKLQEQQLIKQAHLQAIHETGSKLTHDIKNILQATHTMTQIINDKDTQASEIIDALKKQMPLLTQRLNTTLEKLRDPQNNSSAEKYSSGSLLQWWAQFRHRYPSEHIQFSTNISNDMDIPVDVFTSVIENLMDNVRSKHAREPEIKIMLRLAIINDQLCLSVCDNGSMIEPQLAEQLFKEAVSSQDGYGIGLYQCYELAKSHGYALSLETNVSGRVCFALTQDSG